MTLTTRVEDSVLIVMCNPAHNHVQEWRKVAPNNAVVATSVVAIVVRQGNPKGIHDWDDLTRHTSRSHHCIVDFPEHVSGWLQRHQYGPCAASLVQMCP